MEALREVVRLSLGQGQPTLNVLSAGVEGDHLSVVCPFPVLPLEVPVSITMPGGGDAAVSAIIRKVKIELAEETDLPRFKLHLDLLREKAETGEALSIELDEFGAEPAASTPADQDAEPARSELTEPSTAERPTAELELEALTTAAAATSADLDETDPEDLGAASESWQEDIAAPDVSDGSDGPTEHGEDPFFAEVDPPWAATGFENALPQADEMSERRPLWPVRIAVAFGLIVAAAAVGYVARDQIATFARPLLGDRIEIAGVELDLTGAEGATQAESRSSEPAQEGIESHAHLALTGAPADSPSTATAEPAAEADSPISGESQVEEPSPQPALAGESAGPAPAVQDSGDRIRVTLPTQWPVSEARSYRLHDPTGIVVDVPGGLASPAARWIDTAHDRVRSVRVLEREDGVRFIIYLNDERVPRYRVGYGQNGVTVDILGPDPRHVAS